MRLVCVIYEIEVTNVKNEIFVIFFYFFFLFEFNILINIIKISYPFFILNKNLLMKLLLLYTKYLTEPT